VHNAYNVKFKYIPKEQCEIVGTEIEAISTKTMKGTMKIHAIVDQGSNTYALCTWMTVSTKKKSVAS
jgi:hypothetical protein